MCGILGVVGGRVARSNFSDALDLLRHRGPDDHGIFHSDVVSLGHRRLSIIDLSAAAKQPMHSADDEAILVFNGEIYNYIELRKELKAFGYRFETDSDSEVLLAAYQKWGADCLGKLNGMWAFAIWEPREKKLFFARDRFGVKPFYFVWDDDRFLFASEPKALLEIAPEYRKVDQVALYEFLVDGNLYGHGRSFYENVRVLDPGHSGIFDVQNKKLRLTRYWDYPEATENADDLETTAANFADLFDDSVRLRLRSDVEVGLTLSGGLDSSAILASMNRSDGFSPKCFTSTYPGGMADEFKWAKRAASHSNNPLIRVEASGVHWIDTLRQIAWHMDGPGYSPAVYPLWHLMADARSRGVTVMLEGQGADELLGGYAQHSVLHMLSSLSNAMGTFSSQHLSNAVSTMRGLFRTYPAMLVFLRTTRELFPFLLASYRRKAGSLGLLRREFGEAATRAGAVVQKPIPTKYVNRADNRLMYDHSYGILPGLLHYGDAISMAHGVESRNPFLDYRLVEWIFGLPASTKLAFGQTKWPVRDYLRSAGQDELGNRWDKKGYLTPVAIWMRNNGGEIVREVLTRQDARINEYCHRKEVGDLIESFLAGRSGAENHIYRLISTETWLNAAFPN